MGVKSLWQSLIGADLVEQWNGQNPADIPAIAAELDGKVFAVDLSMWVMQAGEQIALTPYCNQDEAAAKVAFERAIHWLRFGILPVFVIEGFAPAEKRSAQQSRLYDGGRGTSNARINAYNNVYAASTKPTQFIDSCQKVAEILKAMGFPTIQAPGEAEAMCAALCTAGLVDGAASFDGDTLVFGAEIVYPVVRLSATQEKTCTLTKCTLAAVRRHLGLTAPDSGRHALGLYAVLCRCDYDESGAQGVGGVGAMALVKNLLQGQTDDKNILDKFEILLRSRPDPSLAGLVKCTGCAQCKHEGGKTGKIKVHNASNNPCPCCPASGLSHQGCIPRSGKCQCTFHRRINDRLAERFAAKARAEPDFAQRARDAVGVFFREAEQAYAAVEQQMILRNMMHGEKFTWLHRPNVKAVYQAITTLQGGGITRTVGGALDWDLSTLRSKMIPALIEWDLRHPPLHSQSQQQVEFLLKIIKKVQGSGIPGTQWRYLVDFERAEGVDIEKFGNTSLMPLKTKSVAGAVDILLDTDPDSGGNDDYDGGGDFCATQRPIENAKCIDVGVFDGTWLASELGKGHRGVRMSLIREKYPEMEAAFLDKKNRVAATPVRRRRSAGGDNGDIINTGAGTSKRQRKQQVHSQQPMASLPRVYSPTKSLTNTPARHRQHQEQFNMPPGSIDRYLVQQARDKVSYCSDIDEEEDLRRGRPDRGVQTLVAGDGGAAEELNKRRGRKYDEDEQEAPSPSIQQLGINDNTPSVINNNNNNSASPSVPTRARRESEALKTIKTVMAMRTARLAAEAKRVEAMSEEYRAQWFERARKRGADVGRLLASGGGGSRGGSQLTKTETPPPSIAKQEEEVIDLVSPLPSSSSEEEQQEEKVQIKRQRDRAPGAVSPAQKLKRRSWRQQQHQRDQEEVVIDLTGDSD